MKKNMAAFKRLIIWFGLGAFLASSVLGGVFLYSGAFELPVAVSRALRIQPETFPIHMKVDFGPVRKPAYHGALDIEQGTTPKEAVSQVFPVLSGKSCCSTREVSAINGVKVNPSKNRWWICLVNGSKNISPQKKRLKRGDVVEWKYIQD